MGWGRWDEEEKRKRENTGIEKIPYFFRKIFLHRGKLHPIVLFPQIHTLHDETNIREREPKCIFVFPGTTSAQPLMKGAE